MREQQEEQAAGAAVRRVQPGGDELAEEDRDLLVRQPLSVELGVDERARDVIHRFPAVPFDDGDRRPRRAAATRTGVHPRTAAGGHPAARGSGPTAGRHAGAGTADTGERGTYGWTQHILGAPGYRIAGGSDEMQRNIIAERALGLPKEPTTDRDRPWRDLPH
jgi:hypothetical protein